ncbi:CDP-diacylglycerol--glycerol-3-phosphate 3-phosphatidyltransferase [Candidatus Pacearchaeota archaeon]|nr:CDP-diacylglycerol--glycerol-3-phosphate 3-phosphatidyltransferase [Candidatus Pacearchaeota archaeon]
MNLPNRITISRILLIPVFITLFYFLENPNKKIILAILFAIMALSDFLDGYLARKNKKVTKSGALLDPIADKLITIAVIILYVGNGIPHWMALILISRDIIVSGVRALALEYRKIIGVSILGKIKTTIEMISLILIILEINLGTILLGAAALLSVVSGTDYVIKGLREIKKEF